MNITEPIKTEECKIVVKTTGVKLSLTIRQAEILANIMGNPPVDELVKINNRNTILNGVKLAPTDLDEMDDISKEIYVALANFLKEAKED